MGVFYLKVRVKQLSRLGNKAGKCNTDKERKKSKKGKKGKGKKKEDREIEMEPERTEETCPKPCHRESCRAAPTRPVLKDRGLNPESKKEQEPHH